MRSAVWALLVVAPPISSGVVRLSRCISPATVTISSRDGVIRPLRPIMSARLSFAAFRMSCHGTITPRSMTSKPLHCRTTPTMFLPMSWTSPLTVAITIRPLPWVAPVEDHVLAGLAQLRIDRVIDVELAGVHDAHVHAGGNGMVEEDAMHRATHGFVAAEGEAEVRETAGYVRAPATAADFARRLDK